MESADRKCRRRSAVVARRYCVETPAPSPRELLTVSTETWRRLADVGIVETMVGVEGANYTVSIIPIHGNDELRGSYAMCILYSNKVTRMLLYERKGTTWHSPLLLLTFQPQLLKPNTNIKDFLLFEDLLDS